MGFNFDQFIVKKEGTPSQKPKKSKSKKIIVETDEFDELDDAESSASPTEEGDKGSPCKKLPWTPPAKKNIYKESVVSKYIDKEEKEELKKFKEPPPQHSSREAAEKISVRCTNQGCNKVDEKYPTEIGRVKSYVCDDCIRRTFKGYR